MAQPPSGGQPHHPYGPYGGPPQPPHQPPPPQQAPQGAQGASPPTPPGPPAPTQPRGCAVAAVSALTAATLALMAGGVWGIISLRDAGGAYEAAPDCEVARTSALESLVSDYETAIEQPIAGLTEDWREGYECRWITPEDGTRTPAAARVAMVHNSDHSGGDAEDEAASALRDAAEGSSETVKDLGDTALAWNETEADFDWGCVGVQLSNLFVMSCYTAAIDFQASESIPPEESIAGAEELATDITQRIQDGEF